MVVAGILLKGNVARIVCLSGSRESHAMLGEKINKLELPKHPAQEDVEVLRQAIRAFCQDFSIDKIVINRRAVSGQGAGGAGTFLMEGVLLSVSKIPIEFVHPATLRATNKKFNELKAIRPQTMDLGKAYDLAFEGLN